MYGPPILKKRKSKKKKADLGEAVCELINIFSVIQSESLNNI